MNTQQLRSLYGLT